MRPRGSGTSPRAPQVQFVGIFTFNLALLWVLRYLLFAGLLLLINTSLSIHPSVDDYEQKFGDIGREMFYKVMRPTSHMPMMK